MWKKSSMTGPDEGFPHMRNKDSGARTGLAPAIPARCLFYPHFSTVCVEGGGLPDSSLTGPNQSPLARHSYTDCSCSDRPGAVPRTSVPVTPATPCVETTMTKWQQFSREFSSSDSRVYSGEREAIIFIKAGSTYLMTKVSMSARSGNKNRLRCT